MTENGRERSMALELSSDSFQRGAPNLGSAQPDEQTRSVLPSLVDARIRSAPKGRKQSNLPEEVRKALIHPIS
jgi:hypothetical protein